MENKKTITDLEKNTRDANNAMHTNYDENDEINQSRMYKKSADNYNEITIK